MKAILVGSCFQPGVSLGWVKVLEKLLLIDLSHLIAWDLLHQEQLRGDSIEHHGFPGTQKHTLSIAPTVTVAPPFQSHHMGCATLFWDQAVVVDSVKGR